MDVLVKYITGETKRGDLHSFNANQPTFYLQVQNEEGKVVSSAEKLDSVQQILYLKKEDPKGSPVRMEKIGQSTFAATMALRLTVEFKDGAVLTGTTHKYNPNERGFYLVPLNPADRSERIFITAHAVKRVDSMKLFGKVLIDENKITQKQLEAGLERQMELREKKIGDILQEKNIITGDQLRESLRKQEGSRKRLGEILREAGYITSEHRKIRLGQILVELKFLTPNDICIALATQFHCAWVDLSDMTIAPEVVSSLPEEIVKRREVIPVEKRAGNILVVATSEPQNPDIAREVAAATSLKVELAVAYEVYIARTIVRYFGGEGVPKREEAVKGAA